MPVRKTNALVSPDGRSYKGSHQSVIPSYTCHCTVMLTAAEGMPFAITTNVLAPVSIDDGTSKLVETVSEPVATPMLLWLWVRA